MKVYDSEPTDDELTELLDASGRSVNVKLAGTFPRLFAYPREYSVLTAFLWMLIPIISWVAIIMLEFGKGRNDTLFLVLAIWGSISGMAACATLLAILAHLNRKSEDRGTFFVLDKLEKTLLLPRLGVTLTNDQIHSLVEVHAWHKTKTLEGSTSEAIAELSVLVYREDNKLERLPVIALIARGKVSEVAKRLSDVMKKETRIIRRLWPWQRGQK